MDLSLSDIPDFDYESRRIGNELEEKKCEILFDRPIDLGFENLTLETDDESVHQEKSVADNLLQEDTSLDDLFTVETVVNDPHAENEIKIESKSDRLNIENAFRVRKYRPYMTRKQMNKWFHCPISLILAQVIPVVMIRTVHLMIAMVKRGYIS